MQQAWLLWRATMKEQKACRDKTKHLHKRGTFALWMETWDLVFKFDHSFYTTFGHEYLLHEHHCTAQLQRKTTWSTEELLRNGEDLKSYRMFPSLTARPLACLQRPLLFEHGDLEPLEVCYRGLIPCKSPCTST